PAERARAAERALVHHRDRPTRGPTSRRDGVRRSPGTDDHEIEGLRHFHYGNTAWMLLKTPIRFTSSVRWSRAASHCSGGPGSAMPALCPSRRRSLLLVLPLRVPWCVPCRLSYRTTRAGVFDLIVKCPA